MNGQQCRAILYGNSLILEGVRASLESPHTGERQSFTDLEQLFAFLSDQCESQIPHRLEKEDT